MIRPQDNYADDIAAIVAQLVSGDRAAAAVRIADISYAKQDVVKRPSIPLSIQVRVFRRDCWTCRYCGGRTIFMQVMKLLGAVFPDDFPYHPNWKAGLTHPAISACCATIDHVIPGSQGGAWLDETNLVTACWPCNIRKGDLTLNQLGWELRPVDESSWDGLAGFYPKLWAIAGHPTTNTHPAWLRALSIDAGPRRQ